MRPLLALAVLLASAIPALGLDCSFTSADGERLVPAPGHITIASADGSELTCTLKGNGPGNPILTGICDDGSDWPYFMISSTPKGPADIVIFINTAWYESCV